MAIPTDNAIEADPRSPHGPRFMEFLRKIPKTDLHFHLLGAVRPQTLIELAIKHVVELPCYDPAALYRTTDFEQSMQVLRALSHCILDPEDFSRILYEALEDSARKGNARHVEVFFNPTVFQPLGVSYAEMIEGLSDGIRRAERDVRVSCLLIPAIDREKSPRVALQMVKGIGRFPCSHVAGIGMDFSEGKGLAASFEPAYRLAGEMGLKGTAHVCESNQPLALAPPSNVRTCVNELRCDRLDHGYNILADAETVAFARDHGIVFCTCPPTAVPGYRARRAWTIAAMRDAGLKLTINTDDPCLYGSDLEDAWTRLFEITGWGMDVAREFTLNGIDASWLGAEAKQRMRAEFVAEFDRLQTELLG